MRVVSLTGTFLIGGLLWAQSAAAATITSAIDFVASDFTSTLGSVPAPISPVSASFTLTFDPSLTYLDESAGIVLNHIDIAVSGVPVFSYDPNTGGSIGISMSPLGAAVAAAGTNDFLLSIGTSPGVGHFFAYTQEGIVDFFQADKLVLTMNPSITQPPIPGTPIPGSVVMLLTGLAGIGGAGFLRERHRKRPRAARAGIDLRNIA